MNEIIHGECLEVMKGMPDNSVDSIVSDPPYGISFMGKKWDYDVPSVQVWQEVLRVLKPGGHALIACGTRTQHRMAVNIEDAGFEMRDVIAYVYGSGFPKSLNIGKAVDKLQGNEREITETYTVPDIKGDAYGTMNDKQGGSYKNIEVNKTKGISEYEGWGTALKPAMELWTLARKPLSEKTVAENVLKWGTGGINIDGSRVGTEEVENGRAGRMETESIYQDGLKPQTEKSVVTGRFPANLIHDGSDEVVNRFPDSKGSVGKRNPNGRPNDNKLVYGDHKPQPDTISGYVDSGSAYRFFYTAKASKAERMGSTHPTMKPLKLMEYLVKLITPPKGTCLDPFLGSGTTLMACKKLGFNGIGIEREEEYCEIARKRLAETQTPLL